MGSNRSVQFTQFPLQSRAKGRTYCHSSQNRSDLLHHGQEPGRIRPDYLGETGRTTSAKAYGKTEAPSRKTRVSAHPDSGGKRHIDNPAFSADSREVSPKSYR